MHFLQKVRSESDGVLADRIIVINGLPYGGTNILWNIIQSHPHIVSPHGETGEIIFHQLLRWIPTDLLYPVLTKSRFLGAILHPIIAQHLNHQKLKNINDPDDRFQYPDVKYTLKTLNESFICCKSTGREIELTSYFASNYRNPYFIGLIRNGYAWCNSWMRRLDIPSRGGDADTAGKKYVAWANRMINDAEQYEKYLLLRFEDCIEDPFGVSETIFNFLNISPTKLDSIRLKSKKQILPDGDHQVRYGEQNRKYWFTRNTIGELLDIQVNANQIDLLSSKDKAAFEKHANTVLKYFCYN